MISQNNYNDFIIRLEGFTEARAFHQLFPDSEFLPEYKNPYLRNSHESRTFDEGAEAFYKTLSDFNFDGGELVA